MPKVPRGASMSEPGAAPVRAVLVAEFLLEHLRLLSNAVDLQRDEHRKDEQEPGLRGEDHDAQDHQTAEYVDRIAYAGIKAGSYQNGSFGLNAERAAKLEPGNDEQQQRRERDGHAGDVRGSPWNAASMGGKDNGSHKDQCERDEVELHDGGLHILPDSDPRDALLCQIERFTDVSILHCERRDRQGIRQQRTAPLSQRARGDTLAHRAICAVKSVFSVASETT